MRIERSKYATEALLSFSSKVRRRATDIDHSTNYQQLMDDDDSSPLRPAGNKFVRKKSNNFRWKTIVSCADTAAERFVLHNSRTDEESRDDDHKYLLGGGEDRCQVMETFTSSSEEDKPYNRTATTKLLLLPGLVDFGGSSRQGPLTLHELGLKPLKKTVHFSTVDVKMYRWDRKYDKDVYYTKNELSNISKRRHEDAAKLRKERLFSGQHTKDLTPTLLSFIFDPNDDIYKRATSRGVEHFIYPELRRELIRKQKEARAEVLKYVRSNQFDPDGSKLRELSEQYTRWARELAVDKAKCYAQNNALFLSKKEVMRQSVVGSSTGINTSIVKKEATILEFKKVKISLDDVEAALGKTSIHKYSDRKDESENTATESNDVGSPQQDFCTLVEI